MLVTNGVFQPACKTIGCAMLYARADLSQPLDYHGKLAAKHRQMLDVSSVGRVEGATGGEGIV